MIPFNCKIINYTMALYEIEMMQTYLIIHFLKSKHHLDFRPILFERTLINSVTLELCRMILLCSNFM